MENQKKYYITTPIYYPSATTCISATPTARVAADTAGPLQEAAGL